MADTSQGRGTARGARLLDQTSEDRAAGIFRIQVPGGAIGQLSARQVEIMGMSTAEKHHVPFHEMIELGKIMMNLQRENVDAVLREIDENPPEVPELVPEPYEYTSLKKPNSLRLLQMLPEDENGMMHVSLDEYDLDEHIPSYYCLSYCWSNPHVKSNRFNHFTNMANDYDDENLYPIACNGRLLYIRANLYDALKQLPAAPGLQLKRWYKLNGSMEKCTDMHVSAAEGDLALTKTNIFRGAIIDARDSRGRTAVTLAVINGHLPVVKVLLEAGSDPQIRDYDGFTSLDHALNHDRHDIVDFLLTFNSANVNRYKRKNKHVGQGIKTWIDAICINQHDLQEKNEQVSVMDRIYSQANFVTIWLGRDDGSAALASSAVHKLFSVAVKERNFGETELVPYKATDPEDQQRNGLPYISEAEWTALAALYLRQQFHRIWCLQEAVLCEDVVMYLGEHLIPWDEFMMVTEQLYMMQKKYAIPPSAQFRPFYTAAIESEAHLISELRMRKALDERTPEGRQQWFDGTKRFWRGENKKCQIPLLEMILSTFTFECSDPRDHIYGFMGMCRNHPESPQIQVDYAKPWEEVYTEVMRLCLGMENESPLRLVSMIKDSALYNNENLPSWVLHFGQAGISPVWNKHHAAAGEDSTNCDLIRSSSGRENELVLESKKVDIIKDVATKRPPGSATVSMYNFDVTWPLLILSLPQIYPHTKETRTEVLWRTLCGDSPSIEDIVSSMNEHSKKEQSTSAEPLTGASKAPSKYAGQFREQLCAAILSHAEKQADMALKVKNTPGGVMLQALMSLQASRDGNEDKNENEPRTHKIYAPTKEELTEMRDVSLDGPYYSNPHIQQAIEAFELVYQTDSRQFGGPGCSTPSRNGIAEFLRKPRYRVWYPNADDRRLGIHITPPSGPQAEDFQVLDELPPGQGGFRTQFSRFNGGRRLFTTETHQYLGLGGMSMQPGDEVWIVKGSKVPFLLRKVGEEDVEDVDSKEKVETSSQLGEKGRRKETTRKRSYYRYIGDLYVHGIMHGEAVASSGDWEDIALL